MSLCEKETLTQPSICKIADHFLKPNICVLWGPVNIYNGLYMVTGPLGTQIFGFEKLSAILYIYGWVSVSSSQNEN